MKNRNCIFLGLFMAVCVVVVLLFINSKTEELKETIETKEFGIMSENYKDEIVRLGLEKIELENLDFSILPEQIQKYIPVVTLLFDDLELYTNEERSEWAILMGENNCIWVKTTK